jgi:hypothetical protein
MRWSTSGETEVAHIPVFSNIGEPGKGRAPLQRPATAVVFGLAGVEDRIYGMYWAKLEPILSNLGVTKVFDVGPRFSSKLRALPTIPIISKGTLPASALSELLQETRFGLIAYSVEAIGKSGVFAAYAAHGVVPVVLAEKRQACDGLEPDRHFIDGLRLNADHDASSLAAVQQELYSWYAPHSAKAQTVYLHQLIRSVSDVAFNA